MLELRDAKLELLELVAGHEIELVRDAAQHGQRSFGEPCAAAADATRQLEDQLLERVEDQPVGVTARGHAA